jgi:molybdopterin-guanine dinucleotide biosynthesis protein A
VTAEFAAVVLAGGRARRLGGQDKLALAVGGRSLLERTLAAVAHADPLVVVGPHRAIPVDVIWTREEPPGAGPLAGLSAGLAEVPRSIDLVAVLAADHPHLTPETMSRLVNAVTRHESAGAVLTDPDNIPQWLVGVWRAETLRRRMPAEVRDRSIRGVLAPLEPERVPAVGAEASDVDTSQDLRRADERA